MATFSWTKGTSGAWKLATNWTPGTLPTAADDVIIDATPVAGAYTVTIAAGESETVKSLAINVGTANTNGTNSTPYNAALFEMDGTLTLTGPGTPATATTAAVPAGELAGSLQTFIITHGGTFVNVGTINGFIQADGNVLFTGTNGFYVTNWLQELGTGTATVDTQSIAEMTGNTLFDGIYEAKGTGSVINLGAAASFSAANPLGLIVNIATIEGPPLIADGWTELLLNDPTAQINEWNGTAYVPLESTLKEIASRGTLDVLANRDYKTANTLAVDAGGMLNLQAGLVTAAAIDINGGVVQGFATIAGDVVNNGSLIALSGTTAGTLTVGGALSGTGVVAFDTDKHVTVGTPAVVNAIGATLKVNSVSAGQSIVMNGDDTLVLTTPAAFAGKIQAKVGDKIVLQGLTATSAVDNNGTLVVSNGANTVASLTLVGDYSADHFTTTGSTVAIGAGPTPVTTPSNFTILDTTTGVTTNVAGDPYTGPVAGLQNECIDITTDSLNITSLVPNVFLRSGSGTDGLNVSLANGNNVLDGSTGSNFLTGGTGDDTFYMDDRDPTSPVFSTIVNFHSGDNATVFGVNQTDFTLLKLDNQGAAGFTGLDLIFTAPGHIDVSFVLAGYTSADLTNGRLTTFFGTTPDLPGLPGSQFMTVHAN